MTKIARIITLLSVLVVIYSLTRYREGFNEKGKIYVVYHIYCNNNTKSIVQEQVLSIIMSGLYEEVDSIQCFLTGDELLVKDISNFIKKAGNKFKIVETNTNDRTYERFTLLKIHDIITENDKILYIHSKGVTQNGSENVYWWRLFMEYYLMRNVKENISYLDTYDILGVAYTENVSGPDGPVGPHFSGNFWWSTGKYYKSLKKYIGPQYNDPEAYIFTGNPKYKMLDGKPNGSRNLYFDPITSASYL